MLAHIDETRELLMDTDRIGNSYFGNPYSLGYEKFLQEHLDGKKQEADEIESVVILGYN